MSEIRVLDSHIADLIAAGEVVERPASVAKELMENAIDAGANSVTVEISHGGLTFLRVTDDGSGIPAKQLKTAFLRHATSKLRTQYDLEAIGTLGFRGEALAAIAAVSRIDVMSRTADVPLGASLSIEGGVSGELEEAGCPLGTTMVVRDLFYNTPARLKFMKKDAAEGAAVFAVVQRVALSHPEVSVKFIRDGRQELLTPGDGQLKSAVYAVLGRELALGFLPVQGSGEDMTVTGFVSMPTCCRGSRNYQYFFVNGRQIKSRLMMAALEEAYKNTKMVGKFPGCVLHLETKLNAVDVNVHPAKTEVKFGNERRVFDAVYHSVLSVLTGDRSRPTVQMKDISPEKPMNPVSLEVKTQRCSPVVPTSLRPSVSQAPRPSVSGLSYGKNYGKRMVEEEKTVFTPKKQGVEKSVDFLEKSDSYTFAVEDCVNLSNEQGTKKDEKPFSTPPVWNVEKSVESVDNSVENVGKSQIPSRLEPLPVKSDKPQNTVKIPSECSSETVVERTVPTEPEVKELPIQEIPWRMVGEVHNTYIIVEQGETVLFIDKHAAHERMNFDRMKAQGYQPMVQSLLTPVTVRPSAEELEVLLGNLPVLEEFGFQCEDFGGGALIVRQAPFDVDVGEIEGTLLEIAGTLLTTGRADPGAARDELLHTMACKAAIKGGWKSGKEELEKVVQAVMSGEVKYCPHGRPVAIELTRKQLEKQFKRA